MSREMRRKSGKLTGSRGWRWRRGRRERKGEKRMKGERRLDQIERKMEKAEEGFTLITAKGDAKCSAGGGKGERARTGA